MQKFETFEERQIDEGWEMNMHYNPLDKETEETIDRHKNILKGAHDDFIAFIHHVENQRRAKIQHSIFEEKLNEFTRVDEKDDSDPQL